MAEETYRGGQADRLLFKADALEISLTEDCLFFLPWAALPRGEQTWRWWESWRSSVTALINQTSLVAFRPAVAWRHCCFMYLPRCLRLGHLRYERAVVSLELWVDFLAINYVLLLFLASFLSYFWFVFCVSADEILHFPVIVLFDVIKMKHVVWFFSRGGLDAVVQNLALENLRCLLILILPDRKLSTRQ